MSSTATTIRLFLCGDVMTGRGIDQALPHPGDPTLHESAVSDAREYVALAERANGAFQRPVGFPYIWGDALPLLQSAGLDFRIINLETSLTTSNAYWPDKAVHYRMNPPNIGCLTAARVDACSLANNHVLDWGYDGLAETLETLDRAGIRHAGAGRNLAEASAPAILEAPGKGRVLLFSFGSPTSGVPTEWAATAQRPGVRFLPDLSDAAASDLIARMKQFQQPGDVLVASIHWGANWGYEIPREQRDFAHRLVEQGIAIVHGHSSHHVKSFEMHQHRLILCGCGDFITDYEGIGGFEAYRGDLALMYLAEVDPRTSRVVSLELEPLRLRQFRLHRAAEADARWLRERLDSKEGRHVGR